MNRTLLFALLFAGIFSRALTQSLHVDHPNDTLAVVDSHVITGTDLYERIALMPTQLKITDQDFEAVKKKAVESIVGEYILARSKQEQADTSDWYTRQVQDAFQKMFVRDELFKREIRGRVTITDLDMIRALRRYMVRRKLLAVPFPSMEVGERFTHEWKKNRLSGISNVAILSRTSRPHDTLYISLGSADPALEDVAFRLKDTMDVSGCVQSKLYGPISVALIADEPQPDATKQSAAERSKAVREILLERKEHSAASEFSSRLFRGQTMAADSTLFTLVVKRFWELIRSDTIQRRVPGGYRYLPDDIYHVMEEFHARRTDPIVHGTFGEIRLGDFLQSLLQYDFAFPSVRSKSFMVSFFQILRTMTEAELVAREGMRRGLQASDNVKHDLSVWMDNLASRKAESEVVKTVATREWEPHYSLWRNNGTLVESTIVLKVQEILLTDSLQALQMMEAIRSGVSMDSLARIYTQRMEWRGNGGVSEWFHFYGHEELAGTLMTMSLNELNGPVKLHNGYSILRLLGRKYGGNQGQIDSLLEEEGAHVRHGHQQAAINEFVASQALRHTISIYYDRIRMADIDNISMMTRRTIGFGGKIYAAPELTPQWQWVDLWKKKRLQVP
jgi:hypothetical protein